MSAKERAEFLAWYECQSSAIFDNRSVLKAYCQDDLTVLRQTCTVFRRAFMEIGNVDVFKNPLHSPLPAIRCCGNGSYDQTLSG